MLLHSHELLPMLVVQLSVGDKLMFRQCLTSDDAGQDDVRLTVYSDAAARYMDSTEVAGAGVSTAVAAVGTWSGSSDGHQQQHTGENQDTHRSERVQVQRAQKRSRAHSQSNEECAPARAASQGAAVEFLVDGCEKATAASAGEGRPELESSGILLNASELAAVASLHKVIGGSFMDR